MYNDLKTNAIIDASKFDLDDAYIICNIGSFYFSCGFSKTLYYNNRYMIAIAIIGRIYGKHLGKRSDYSKGVAYLANKCNVSHAQIKSLRKNFKFIYGYKFKVPFEICNIINNLIALLEENRNNELVKKFLSSQAHTFYRNVLIEAYDVAISKRVQVTEDEKIKQVRADLDNIMQTI